MTYLLTLVALAVSCFIQNAAFTKVSRSRNGADFAYHRRCAWASNGVYLVTHLLVLKHFFAALSAGTFGAFLALVPMVLVYIIFTAEGSVWMMKRCVRTEQGNRRVGAQVLEIPCLCTDRQTPIRATDGSAGFDLRADFDGDPLYVFPGERLILGTGVVAAIPDGHFGHVAIRSSLGAKGLRLLNSCGVIDSDYRGEIKVGVTNESDAPICLMPAERIAQIVVVPTPVAKFVPGYLPSTERGAGGFGSTGR